MIPLKNNSEIVLYQVENSISIEVLMENETVWLTLDNLSELYQRNKSTISRHIKNIFQEGELEPGSVVANFATTASDGKTYQIDYYNLDVIISVGYRVKSNTGIAFRKWANLIIKNHILKSNAISLRIDKIEEDVFYLKQKTKEIDTIVKGQTLPVEGVFCDGQIYDAFVFVIGLIKRAKTEIILIDNYIDETVLTMLDNRCDGVYAVIYTASFSDKMKLALQKHNSQYKSVNIKVYKDSHDRFLIIDNEVYHIGASLKDLGKKVFAFSKLNFKKEEFMQFIFNRDITNSN